MSAPDPHTKPHSGREQNNLRTLKKVQQGILTAF